MRAPALIRWPGVIKPGTVKNDIFASLDWLPTLVNIAGGAKGDALKKRIEAGQYPGIVKTTLDGVDQTEYLSGRSEKSARDTFFYYSGQGPVGGPLQELEDVLHDGVRQPATGFICRSASLSTAAQVVNIKRDPFETSIGSTIQDGSWARAARSAAPSTAYIYDWNMLPIGQALWLKELEIL